MFGSLHFTDCIGLFGSFGLVKLGGLKERLSPRSGGRALLKVVQLSWFHTAW